MSDLQNTLDDIFNEICDLQLGCAGCGSFRIDDYKCNQCHINKRLSELRTEYAIIENALLMEELA